MYIIEFLERSGQRNVKNQIDRRVAKHMQECGRQLAERRLTLRQQLHQEALLQDEALALLLQARADEADRQRLDWILMGRLKREKAEAELLKLKQQQREIENSEAYRHMQSKQFLLECKQAQLEQIAENAAMRCRQARVEQLWQQVWQRLDASKAKQEQYEQQLRHMIERSAQLENQKRDEQQRAQRAEDVLNEQLAEVKALQFGAEADARREEQARQKLQQQRQQQHAELQAQIEKNRQLFRQQAQSHQAQELDSNMREDEQIFAELMQKKCAREYNRNWHQDYMRHMADEQAAQRSDQQQLEQAYAGTGCVLWQRSKQPYGKQAR